MPGNPIDQHDVGSGCPVAPIARRPHAAPSPAHAVRHGVDQQRQPRDFPPIFDVTDTDRLLFPAFTSERVCS
jgi:hypothetical protein